MRLQLLACVRRDLTAPPPQPVLPRRRAASPTEAGKVRVCLCKSRTMAGQLLVVGGEVAVPPAEAGAHAGGADRALVFAHASAPSGDPMFVGPVVDRGQVVLRDLDLKRPAGDGPRPACSRAVLEQLHEKARRAAASDSGAGEGSALARRRRRRIAQQTESSRNIFIILSWLR